MSQAGSFRRGGASRVFAENHRRYRSLLCLHHNLLYEPRAGVRPSSSYIFDVRVDGDDWCAFFDQDGSEQSQECASVPASKHVWFSDECVVDLSAIGKMLQVCSWPGRRLECL